MPSSYSFESALDYIASLEGRGWRLGLDRMIAFCKELGLTGFMGDGPRPKFIHIAGTNGKGSVTAFVESLLFEHGFETGGFYSPFVFDVRERITSNCRKISQADFAQIVFNIQGIADRFCESKFGAITEFEFKTAMGLTYWKNRGSQWVACEVGLGGRLDATNVIHSACSVITSIGLDHTQILGDSHAEIAFEKAGIIKQAKPVVVGTVPKAALEVITEFAKVKNSPVWAMGKDWTLEGDRLDTIAGSWTLPDDLGIGGHFALQNAAIAVSAIAASGLKVDQDAVTRGIQLASIPGRAQRTTYENRTFVLDGAHNAESAEALRTWLEKEFPNTRITLIAAMVHGHDAKSFFEPLSGLIESVELTSIDFYRAVSPDDLVAPARDFFPIIDVCADHAKAVDRALEKAGADGLVVVAGSFYLVGAIGRLIGAHLTFESDRPRLRS